MIQNVSTESSRRDKLHVIVSHFQLTMHDLMSSRLIAPAVPYLNNKHIDAPDINAISGLPVAFLRTRSHASYTPFRVPGNHPICVLSRHYTTVIEAARDVLADDFSTFWNGIGR